MVKRAEMAKFEGINVYKANLINDQKNYTVYIQTVLLHERSHIFLQVNILVMFAFKTEKYLNIRIF